MLTRSKARKPYTVFFATISQPGSLATRLPRVGEQRISKSSIVQFKREKTAMQQYRSLLVKKQLSEGAQMQLSLPTVLSK
jgi:hypothetical protein